MPGSLHILFAWFGNWKKLLGFRNMQEKLENKFSIHYRLFGCQDFIGSPGEESNFYDAENQSISNHARLAVKRASF